ncbi:MAG: hypothetical protein IJ128_04625 [Firmicutes bacterium]|nr:hypothetical protein [Bacillota bacterium]
MKIEVLFPEICNLYGDLANIRYLKECLPDVEVINTSLQSRPRFLEEPVDLVYMGTTTENGQILALDQLRFYREQILEQIEKGTHFLITGNAMELFGEKIEEDGEEVCRGLGVFPGIARRSSVNRFNSLFLGTFEPDAKAGSAGEAGAGETAPITVVGFKSQFGHTFSEAGDTGLDHLALFTPKRGPGMNRYAEGEGIRINNFFATYVIGPLLILNPPFTKWYIRNQLGVPIEHLAFEEAAVDSYNCRVEEYSDPKTGLYYWGGTNEPWT